jgi:hypothetical protein
MKIYLSLSGGSRVIFCGWMDGRTDARLKDRHDETNVFFLNFAKAPKKEI